VWYSPLLFARPWTILMGYDPDDKAKLAEMQKSAGPSYMLSLVASLVSAAVLGKIIAIATVNTPLYGIKVGWRCGWICDHGAIDEFAVQPATGQTVRHQHGVSTRLLPGDGAIMGAWR